MDAAVTHGSLHAEALEKGAEQFKWDERKARAGKRQVRDPGDGQRDGRARRLKQRERMTVAPR